MDIRYFDTNFARLGYRTNIGSMKLAATLQYTDVAHLMDNFTQRPAPAAAQQRATFADATTWGGDVSLTLAAFGGDLKVGVEGVSMVHDVTITNPQNSGFSVAAFPDVDMDQLGGFAEWTGAAGPLQAQIGLRADRHSYDAGQAIVGTALPMGPRMLAAAFNAADRSGAQTTTDAVVRLWTRPHGGVSWRLTLAHKQQMPGYIQRFGWLPINASGGLADGNIYVGDRNLKAETAWIAEAGFDYADGRSSLRPTLYIRQVDDYIQGVPFDATIGVADSPVEMIAAMNGDATPLRWANVDARLVGFDVDGGYDFPGPLRVDAVLNYVRGKRRDITDNLYRVSPLNGMVGLTWETARWSATLETRASARQAKISATNSETTTGGYVVVSLFGDLVIAEGIALAAGIENLLDKRAAEHLSGLNRNGFGDVAIGQRVPLAGRGGFIRLSVVR